jgi:hypothetical protein
MSLIRVECESCSTALQVRRELAGQQGRCPVCGALIDIPPSRLAAAAPEPPSPQAAAPPGAPSTAQTATAQPANASPPAPMALSQAGAPEMLAEIHRRKKSAVMVVFETPADGSYAINRKPEAMVRCYRTPDMTDAQLMQVLEQLGHMSQGMQNQKGGIGLQPEGAPLAYELKGDRLGMTLEDFKAKYARKVSGMTLPYCSDSSPGQPNSTLWSEPWHVAAGLVNARVELPSENNSPTIAGLKTDLFIYHFVDGRLFRMTVLFDTEAFHLIHNALVQKQGPPQRENKERMEIVWDNGVSTIKLTRGTMRPKKASTLLYIHNQLQKSAEGRAPKREADL